MNASVLNRIANRANVDAGPTGGAHAKMPTRQQQNAALRHRALPTHPLTPLLLLNPPAAAPATRRLRVVFVGDRSGLQQDLLEV